MRRPLFAYPCVLAAAVLATGCNPSSPSARSDRQMAPAGQLPPLEAEGWLQGSAPTSAELTGHVVVVEAWAYW